jgi:DNA repair protein SbcC/Rad50
MIPVQLQLKNFLSYGSELQTIDFVPYHLICLSGKNGHGKSALLDAMTWAVWGAARKISGVGKADQGLLRLGQRSMMVIFDFLFDGRTYRVRREFNYAYGKSTVNLDFGILDEQSGAFIPLTDKTISKTQEKIESMIRLDYDSFINSAFLRQGSANEFSKKQPRERKEVLANILGLGHYELLRKVAQEKMREAQNEYNGLEGIQERIERELSLLVSVEESYTHIVEQLERCNAQYESLLNQGILITRRKQVLHKSQQELSMLCFERDRLQKTISAHEQSIRLLVDQWRSVARVSAQLSDMQSLMRERDYEREQILKYQAVREKHCALKEQLVVLTQQEHSIHRLRTQYYEKHVNELKVLIEREAVTLIHGQRIIEQHEHMLKSYELAFSDHGRERVLLIEEIAKNSIDNTVLVARETRFEKRKEQYHTLTAQGQSVVAELEELYRRHELVQDGDHPSCPLCQQGLSIDRKNALKHDMDNRIVFLEHRKVRLAKLLALLKKSLCDEHEELKKMRHRYSLCERLKHQLVECDRVIDKTGKEIKFVQDQRIREHNNYIQGVIKQEERQKLLKIQIEQLHYTIEHDQEYMHALNLRKACEEELNTCLYDAQAYEKTLNRVRVLEQQCFDYERIREQLALQNNRLQELYALNRERHVLRTELVVLEEKIKSFSNLADQERILAQDEHYYTSHSKQIAANKEELLRERGRLEHEKQVLERLIKEQKEYKQRIEKLTCEIDDYKIIAQALSKEGIQALLIEDAVPEIEAEANILLGKLTDNQSQLFIESLRDLKKGGTKETLDINISDGAGMRPYEMFSGGEAFRIDFALRIAISKLLTRRAGTSLQTLIIDEGFGSQDDDGLAHIMDAIYRIQEDFSKVIIVSHLPMMKDQFPVHFVVEKGPAGSVVKVLEQG